MDIEKAVLKAGLILKAKQRLAAAIIGRDRALNGKGDLGDMYYQGKIDACYDALTDLLTAE